MLRYTKKSGLYALGLRKNMTKEECHLWFDFLKSYPQKFYSQRAIGQYIVDFYCAKAKLVIELDGGGHYEPEQWQYDTERTTFLEKYNLKVLRFTNIDIQKNFYGICTLIDTVVKERLQTSTSSMRNIAATSPTRGDKKNS